MKVAPVSGVVTLDGQPLERASVFFQPEKGRPSFGVTDASGNYSLNYSRDLRGAEVGAATVKISTGTQAEEDEGKVNKPGSIKGEKVPARYAKDPIKVNVERKANKIDFKLTTNP